MTDTQFLTIVGTIWIAPYSNEWYARCIGCLLMLTSAAKGLGWI